MQAKLWAEDSNNKFTKDTLIGTIWVSASRISKNLHLCVITMKNSIPNIPLSYYTTVLSTAIHCMNSLM